MSDEVEVVGNEVYPMPVIVYGKSSHNGTTEVREHLQRRRIAFVEHDIEIEPEAARYVQELNQGNGVTPVVVFGDQEIVLFAPTEDELYAALREAGYRA